jgi:hypothetical protein
MNMKKNSEPEATFDQDHNDSPPSDFAERVRLNQRKPSSALKPQYDFIVCGSGHPVR